MMYTGSIGLAEFPREKNPTYELYLALYICLICLLKCIKLTPKYAFGNGEHETANNNCLQ
jgi:hypothetical protein